MGLKTAGVGHFQIPTAPAAGVSVVSGTAGVLTATAIVLSASTSAMYITGVHVETSAALAATYILVQLCVGGSGAETSIGQYLVPLSTGSTVALGYRQIYPPIPMAAGARLTVKTADSVGSKTYLVTAECILQSNVVDDGITVGTVNLCNTVTTYTGNTPQTGDTFAVCKSGGTGDNAAIKAKTDNLPAAPASTTNITAASGVALAASQHVIVDSGTVTTLTNLPAITAGWLTATGITAGALNGKGDWLLSSGYTAPPSAATIAGATWDVTLSGHLTAGTTGLALNGAGSAGDPWSTALPGAYAAGTAGKIIGDKIVASVTGNVGGSVASVTADVGITQAGADKVWGSAARTLTSFGTLVADMATAVWGAVTRTLTAGTNIVLAKGVGVTGFNDIAAGAAMTLTAAYDPAKTAAQAGNAMTLTGLYDAAKTAATQASVNAIPTTPLLAGSYTAPDNAGIAAIKLKTDSLAFSAAGKVDANMKAINDVAVTGTGAAGNLFGV